MGRIHDFFAVALAEQGWALRKSAVGLFQVVDQTATAVARFTDDRERAMAMDGLWLLELDHPPGRQSVGKVAEHTAQTLELKRKPDWRLVYSTTLVIVRRMEWGQKP